MKSILFVAVACIALPTLPDFPGQKEKTGPSQSGSDKQGKKVPVLPKLDDEEPKPGKAVSAQKPGARSPGAQAPDELESRARMRAAGAPYSNLPSTDLIQHFPEQNPFLGVWSVTRIVRPQAPATGGSGWMIFTRAYVSIHLMQPGIAATYRPKFETAMRSYRVFGNNLVTTSLMGVRNSVKEGEILLERTGLDWRRKFAFVGQSLLRIYQGPGSYIELKLVERL